uniref:Alkaline phosphatase n=1 Tax=Corethrella appendiculata TaxID=1370023 RepID=U5ETR5_9DIPT
MKFLIKFAVIFLTIYSPINCKSVHGPYREDDESRMHPNLPATDRSFLKNPKEETNEYWEEIGQEFVEQQINRKLNLNTAKNIILFMGDGMSIATVSAARVYSGGEEQQLEFEKSTYTGSSKTYCVNYQVADSACSATAYLTGVKGNMGTIGVNGQVKERECRAAMDPKKQTESIASWAMKAGKDAGLVTTTRVTHASPAGVFAHIADRDWENNVAIEEANCDSSLDDDITEQLVHGHIGKQLKVILGGGRGVFTNTTDKDPETQQGGWRTDGKNLINEWLENEKNLNSKYVWNRTDLMNIDAKTTDRLLGLFDPSHCQYNLDIKDKNMKEEPSLSEMVDKAIDILSKNEKGFFLFVEGGRIDHGHHGTQARYALDETVEFSKAYKLARDRLSESDTLIVVTADHAHTMSYAGYPNRGNDIFGTAGSGSNDKLPYMTLSYANGPGFDVHVTKEANGRVDVRKLDTKRSDFKFPTTVPLDSETHGGEDVAIYASGPFAHLFSGTIEQNVIPHTMAYAACIGDGITKCGQKK